MRKKFNVTGLCVPEKHYMADLTERILQIEELIDSGAYFTINRARQYGKTTTLAALSRALKEKYLVISLDFQMLGSASFQNENTFSLSFLQIFYRELERSYVKRNSVMDEVIKEIRTSIKEKDEKFDFLELFEYLLAICNHSEKPVILLIDEVDSATNNQVFLDFLAQLRGYYIERDNMGTVTFQSVILAGVYDVKNLKRKIRSDEEHKVNSPWITREDNEPCESLLSFGDCPRDHMVLVPYDIATDFNVDMSLTKSGIIGMLKEYEEDCRTGMNIEKIAGLLLEYTCGYPYLVSRLCKWMDENSKDADSVWTEGGFLEAVRVLLSENNMLFDSLIGKIMDYPELNGILEKLLFSGKTISYNPTNPSIQFALMFGLIKNEDGKVVPANRIFDTVLYNHFLSMDELQDSDIYKASLIEKNQFITGGRLNMRRVLEKFVEHFHDLYGKSKKNFVEEDGRRYFLLYLRPIINGTGNYYVESRTRSFGRTDLIVDYKGERFLVEMKIWHGNEYNTRGEEQLASYLADYHLSTGYMLSFNFNQKKQIGIQEHTVNGKTLIEAIV